MHVSSVYLLRQALGLDQPGTPVKVVEPYQMLGEIKEDLQDRLGVDVVGLGKDKTLFGFPNQNWKPWTTFDGTPVLVPGDFNTEPEENGDILMYPEGDKDALPSGRMPKGGFYFDTLIRQSPIDESRLRVEDNLEEFGPITVSDLEYLGRQADHIYRNSNKAVLANFGGTAFGDIALVPAPWFEKIRRGFAMLRNGISAPFPAEIMCMMFLTANARLELKTWQKYMRWLVTEWMRSLCQELILARSEVHLYRKNHTRICLSHFINE